VRYVLKFVTVLKQKWLGLKSNHPSWAEAFCLSGHCVEHQAKTIIQQRESCGSVTVGDIDSLFKTIIQHRESCGSVTVGDIDSLVK
jgi:hypothetical protein